MTVAADRALDERAQRFLPREPLRFLLDNQWVTGASGVTFESVSPFSGEVIATIHSADPTDVEAAVAAARRAFDEGPWQWISPNERWAALTRVARLVERDSERLAYLESADVGKPIGGANWYDVPQATRAWDYYAGKSREGAGSGTVVPVPTGDQFNFRVHEPIGVVAEIIPWNGPLALSASQKVAAALATGNCVILKPSSEACLSVLALGELLVEAGLPPGVVQVLTGPGGVVGEGLLRHPGVDMVSLTGSVETGRRAMALAAPRLKKMALELGGKNPNIVFADADLDEATKWATMGAFNNAGQVCVSGSRLLVQRAIYDEMLERVAEAARALVLGDPLDARTTLGPLVSRRQQEQVLGYVEGAVADGARLVTGGGKPLDPALARGNFVIPTVFADARPEWTICQEEVFGPVLTVTPFEDEAEALRLANGVEFGLAGAVFTRDIARALRVTRRMQAGQIYVNGYFSPSMVESPGVGYKQSGVGEAGFLKYTRPKTVFIRT